MSIYNLLGYSDYGAPPGLITLLIISRSSPKYTGLWNSGDLPIPSFGHINILKIDILPKLLYIFQTILTSVPIAFFHTVRSVKVQFICHRHYSRLKHELFYHQKLEGAGFPDLK